MLPPCTAQLLLVCLRRFSTPSATWEDVSITLLVGDGWGHPYQFVYG